ncbi:MAG TPA: helix-turn-helix domain-containing protein [Actinomycetota bacterium]
MTDAPARESEDDLRDQLSSLQGVILLSRLMTESADRNRILEIVANTLPSLGRTRLEGVWLFEAGWRATAGACTDPVVRSEVEAQVRGMAVGGLLHVPGAEWGWAEPLRGPTGPLGYVVVTAGHEPSTPERFLLRVLSQQLGMALTNAALLATERTSAESLRSANRALGETVAALEHSTSIHERLTQVAASGLGEAGIAEAVHELTGYPIAIEDRHGNLRAWAGPGQPTPYPKDDPPARQALLRRVMAADRPVREGPWIYLVARAREDVIGVMVLFDPSGKAGNGERVALEHGATVLAMDLARLQSLADTELRVRRDLVEELLSGTDEASALARAAALRYDLQRPHRVVVVEGANGHPDDGVLFRAVRDAARDAGVGSLLVSRLGRVVVLSDTDDRPWRAFRADVEHGLGGEGCRVGIGGTCGSPLDFPRSYREAMLALRIQRVAHGTEQVTLFEDLGLYRLLANMTDLTLVEAFVHDWLGSLIDYDEQKGAELVASLTSYLEYGGNYEATAQALAVHRNTLKYRLQRIRDITGRDLGDPDTSFNLHLATRAWHVLGSLRTPVD